MYAFIHAIKMSNQEISLKWNGFQSNILSNVKELFSDDGLSDCTLVSEGHSFKAHKVILSANSLVFKTIFQQNPHKNPIIVLHDINTASLKTLLSFMYNGEVNVTEELLPVLLKSAETLRICGLSNSCEESKVDEKICTATSMPTKKRKKSVNEDNNNKIKRVLSEVKPEAVSNLNSNETETIKPTELNIIPKVEPLDLPLTDYSGRISIETDIAPMEENLDSKCPINTQVLTGKTANDKNVKKWINEVTSTQPCLNAVIEKNKDISNTEDEKDAVEIDKEIETVLQSGTIVESLNIATDAFTPLPNDVQSCKDKNTCYASPSFPCPFCPRVYYSWGYRRRHVKSKHTTHCLSCKWCELKLNSTGAWYSHTTRIHGLAHEEARNSLVVMVEAHAVLTLNEPSVAQLLGQVNMEEGDCNVSEKCDN